jgi:RNA polymerase sigma-70 factor (ECF subfamily)
MMRAAQWTNVREFPRDRCSDSELVAAVAQGDHNALESVWNRYARTVRCTLYSALGPDHALDDLVQEVFVSFYRSAGRLRSPAALKAYLLGSATRIAAFERRSRSRRFKWLTAFSKMRGEADQRQMPEIGRQDVVKSLRRILDAVSERPRIAFLLRYVEDLTVSEIAIAMQTSEATAKRDVARGRKRVLLLASKEPALSEYLRYFGGEEP